MKHSHSRSADFWRTFTLSLAAAGLLFGLGWLFISHNGPQEGPLPESPLLPDESSRLTVLALGVSPENELSLCALLSFQPDLIAVQVAALPPQTVWQTEAGEGTLSAAWQQGGAAYLQSVLSAPSERRELLCTITADGRFAGLVGFKDTDRANRKTEIGYWLGEEYQGRGIMTRCVEALCGLAFSELNINRIQIQCAVGNTKSSNIPRRLGFTLEGIARAGELQADGRFSDIEVYSLLREEYIPRGKRTQYDERRNE